MRVNRLEGIPHFLREMKNLKKVRDCGLQPFLLE